MIKASLRGPTGLESIDFGTITLPTNPIASRKLAIKTA
jgi:hypothetical protein